MSLTTWSENIARFLMVFGLVVVVTMVGVGIYKATLVDDVYDNPQAWEPQANGEPDPATFSDAEVRGDWQDVKTIEGWERPLSFLGLGSILTAIILTFAISIYRGVKVMRTVFPAFWERYLARMTGRETDAPDRFDDDVPLPFGGGA